MTQDRWTAVDAYVEATLLGDDPVLEAVLQASAAAGLPQITVSPAQGRFLFLIAKAIGAKRILELGTLGGYSGVCLARALPPGGQLVTIEADPRHAAVAQHSFARAGVASVVDLRVGKALDVLAQLEAEPGPPFDFVFIDADKGGYADYLEWTVRLCRPGALIIADNVVRKGEVVNANSDDPSVRGIRRFMDRLAGTSQVTATAIQTVGVKGYDGLAIILVGTPG